MTVTLPVLTTGEWDALTAALALAATQAATNARTVNPTERDYWAREAANASALLGKLQAERSWPCDP